jgi:hypothetical protein
MVCAADETNLAGDANVRSRAAIASAFPVCISRTTRRMIYYAVGFVASRSS